MWDGVIGIFAHGSRVLIDRKMRHSLNCLFRLVLDIFVFVRYNFIWTIRGGWRAALFVLVREWNPIPHDGQFTASCSPFLASMSEWGPEGRSCWFGEWALCLGCMKLDQHFHDLASVAQSHRTHPLLWQACLKSNPQLSLSASEYQVPKLIKVMDKEIERVLAYGLALKNA